MESILNDLVSHVGQNMPDLKTVDEDYGQLEILDDPNRDTYPLTFPAVLIDAAETSWSNVEGLSQHGVCTIRVRLIIDCYDDTHYGSGTTGKIMEREEVRKRLHCLLQGHRIGEDGAMMRTSSRFYTFNHGIKVYETTYSLAVTEYMKERLKKVEKVKVVISPQRELEA